MSLLTCSCTYSSFPDLELGRTPAPPRPALPHLCSLCIRLRLPLKLAAFLVMPLFFSSAGMVKGYISCCEGEVDITWYKGRGSPLKVMIVNNVNKLSPKSFQFQCIDFVKAIPISLGCTTIATSSHNALRSG